MEMVSKMKSTSSNPLGSRIASVHNGSSLFTGDAGGGEYQITFFTIQELLLIYGYFQIIKQRKEKEKYNL